MEWKKILHNGIVVENPVFRLVLGMCPTLAVTTAAINGVGMGLATMFVLTMSNLAISALRKLIPDQIRIPVFVVIIATFVTITEMLIKAFLPALNNMLGIYIPLIVVNCIIFARVESFAFKNKPMAAIWDGIGIGLGYTLALTLLSMVRELIGSGTIFGIQFMPNWYQPVAIALLPPGGFIALGLLMVGVNSFMRRRKGAV